MREVTESVPCCDWILEDKLCAMPLPVESDIQALREAGVTLVVTAASEPYADRVRHWCLVHGLRHIRYWIDDMTAPELEDVRDFVAEVSAELARGGRVAVHCLGGVGRTGTLIACYLVHEGWSAEDAISEVRRRRPGSVQTRSQELCVVRYASEVNRTPGRATASTRRMR